MCCMAIHAFETQIEAHGTEFEGFARTYFLLHQSFYWVVRHGKKGFMSETLLPTCFTVRKERAHIPLRNAPEISFSAVRGCCCLCARTTPWFRCKTLLVLRDGGGIICLMPCSVNSHVPWPYTHLLCIVLPPLMHPEAVHPKKAHVVRVLHGSDSLVTCPTRQRRFPKSAASQLCKHPEYWACSQLGATPFQTDFPDYPSERLHSVIFWGTAWM